MKKLLTSTQVGAIRDLLNRWDPGSDSCLPWIVSLVQGGGSVADLTDHLSGLRTDTMGLPADRARDREIAEAIVALATKGGSA